MNAEIQLMAPLSGSSKFISVNLNKSYGQSTGAISNRPRTPSGHGVMVQLTRSKSQIVSSSPSLTAPRASNKLSVPRPVNLPSLRREHAGNDPTVSLVGASGSSGWNKQQALSQTGDTVLASLTGARSATESSWRGKELSAVDESSISEVRLLSHHTSFGRSDGSPLRIQASRMPTERAVVLRGEDFPTLQAASRPSVQHHRESQQKQQATQREQQKMHQQQHTMEQQEEHSNVHMEREKFIGMQGRSMLLFKDHRRLSTVSLDRESKGSLAPLLRLDHTSNWGDDEREALDNFPSQGPDHSMRAELERLQGGYRQAEDWPVNYVASGDFMRPLLRYGLTPGVRRDGGESLVGQGFKGHHSKKTDYSVGTVKENHVDSRFNLDVRDLTGKWAARSERNDLSYRGGSDFTRNMSFVNTGRPSNFHRDGNFNRDNHTARQNGPSRCIEPKAARVIDTARVDADWDMYGQDLAQRGVEVRQHNVLLKDTYPSKHELDGGLGSKEDKFIRSSNTSYQNNELDCSFTAQAGRHDPRILEYGRDKRENIIYNQDDHFIGGILNARANSSNGHMGRSGLEARVARRRKDEAQVCEIRDAARESFEAELERVQKLQDQERQRMIEEHNLAVERARKEQEERERLAREEEEYRLKLQQEAREHELKAQREAEEAAKKMEDDRCARELERQKMILEEQRRKEAARKKLLELEERIAKREAEKKQVEQMKENLFEKVGFRNEDVDWENQDNIRDVITISTKSDRHEQQMYFKNESFLVSGISGGELVKGSPKLWPKISNSPAHSPEQSLIRSRTRIPPKRRQEKLDNDHGFGSVSDSSHLHDSFSLTEREQDWVCERSSPGDLSSTSLQERQPLQLVGRKETMFHNRQQHLPSNDEMGWSQEESLSYLSGTETSDSSLFLRVRRSLPRQPRVPALPTGPILLRHASIAKDTQQLSSAGRDDSAEDISDPNKPSSSRDLNEVGGKDDFQMETHQLQSCTLEDESMVPEVESLVSHEKVGDTMLDHLEEDNKEVSYSNADLESSIEALDNVISDVKMSHKGQDLDEDQCSPLHDMEPDILKQDMSILPGDVELCGASDCLEVDNVGNPANGSTNMSIEASAVRAAESLQDLNEFIDEKYGDAVSGFVEEDRSIEEASHLVGLRKEDTMNLIPEDQGQENMAANLEHACVQVLDHANSEQDLIQASRTQHVSLLPTTGIMPTSLHMGHLEASGSRPVPVQIFNQQPFSFMAMPLSQPTVPGSVVHPSILPGSTLHPSPQNQQEAPFHLQLSFLPGSSVIPNVIQIGSIQMPLHIHSHLPHLSQLQGQPPPMFQFGQVTHSASLSQPLAIVQPAAVHHGTGLTLLSQHNELENNCMDIPGSAVKTVNVMKVPTAIGIASKLNSHKGGAAEGQPAFKTSCSEIENKNESLLKIGTVKAHTVLASSPIHTAREERTTFTHPAGRSDGKGGKRTGGSWSYNSRGWGRGAYRSRKNRGVSSSYIAAERHRTENRHNGSARNRGHTFRRAEYRVRIREQPFQPSDQESLVVTKTRKHQPNPDVSSMREALSKNGHRAQVYEYKKMRTADSGRNLPDSPRATVMTKGDHLNISLGISKSNSSRSKVYLKKYKPDNAGDAPLPTGIVRVYEQPGIEVQNDKDDFIEVRSKRQMLREQRQQREKENKAKSKVSKVMHKQRMAGVHNDVVEGLPSKHSINKQPGILEQSSKEGKLHVNKGLSDNKGSSLVHNIGTSQALPVRSMSGGYIDKTSKSPRSDEAHGASFLGHMESGPCTASVHDKSSSILENASTPSAWGGHRPSQEVVSLMQIQLEEAMKPPGAEVSAHQKHFLERASPGLASKNVVTLPDGTNIGLEVTTTVAEVSVPFSSPVQSLLAGEKIQFGAVTSPTVMPSSSHPTSPAPVRRTGSPLSFVPDMLHMYTSRTERLSGSGVHLPFTSEDSVQGGEGQQDDGQGIDSEAEAAAEAAASAVVIAAIGNDDSSAIITGTLVLGANASGAAFGSVREVPDALVGRGSNSTTAMDDSMSIALPADLSVETGPQLLPGLSASTPPSNFMLPSLPGAPSPFPCLEMGTMLGGPIFTFGPCDPVPVEQGMTTIGTGGLQGWQQRQSNSPDSFYGAPPSGFTGPFVSPTGLPGIQAHPQMLVYANPFASVRQFGQLGVGFMGAAYHPSGKQPDWTHSPLQTSSPGILGMNIDNPNPGHPGPSMLPIAAPLSIFDASLSASFQVNPESSAPSHWSKAPVPHLNNIPVLGPPLVFNMPQQHTNILAPQLGQLPQLTDVTNGPQQMPLTNSSYSAIDVAAQFPDELGLSDSIASTTNALERLCSSGLASASQEQNVMPRGTNAGDEWSNSSIRKAIPGCNVERAGFSSPKLQQVYMAKPAGSLRKVDTHT